MAQHIEYRIDNVLQDYVPELPDSTKVILLDDEACIGYKDIVDRTGCSFKIYTDKSTIEEDTADYEEFLICSPDIVVLTDDDGKLLIDDNGNYLIEG